MVPRGEVGIIVAQIGLSLAVIGPELYGVVLFMAVATTLIAPPFLKLLYAGEPAAEAEMVQRMLVASWSQKISATLARDHRVRIRRPYDTSHYE